MPTDTAPGWARDACNFAPRAVAWNLPLFGLFRWSWVETHALVPVTRLHGRAAVGLVGTPTLPVEATLACTGADALAHAPRGGSWAHSRSEHAAHRQPGPGCHVAGVVRDAPRLSMADGTRTRDYRVRLRVDALRGSAADSPDPARVREKYASERDQSSRSVLTHEKSFSRRALREILERAGFKVVAETAILFIPGWLRMLDLACYSWCRPFAAVTGASCGPLPSSTGTCRPCGGTVTCWRRSR